jgi:hypothetical protein
MCSGIYARFGVNARAKFGWPLPKSAWRQRCSFPHPGAAVQMSHVGPGRRQYASLRAPQPPAMHRSWQRRGLGARPGEKNWIHLGSAQAGPKIAAIFSVVESCRRNEDRGARISGRRAARPQQHLHPAPSPTYARGLGGSVINQSSKN